MCKMKAGLSYLNEHDGRLLLTARVLVWVVTQRHAPVCLLDVALTCMLMDFEDGVQVFFCGCRIHLTDAHRVIRTLLKVNVGKAESASGVTLDGRARMSRVIVGNDKL